MKTQLKPGRKILASVAVALLATVWVLWSGRQALAVPPVDPDLIATGLVGVTFGQSVQLNVSNADPPEPSRPVSVELMIFDADGVMVAHSTERLIGGRSASLMLNRDTLPGRAGNRVGLRGLMRAQPPDPVTPTDPNHRAKLIASFEVVDNATQRTLFALPGSLVGFNPQPEPPMPQM
ncbi:MAG TPA: hypothetical protein VGK99_16075 [Acidobacteriota bacterium]|jgi:hypothetical protein